MDSANQPLPPGYPIDDLLRLQSRYATMIWRLKEQDGIEIEFFLEELAIDCSAALNRAGIPASHRTERPRLVWLPGTWLQTQAHDILPAELAAFLEKIKHPTYLTLQERPL